jgi:hypothetical protein
VGGRADGPGGRAARNPGVEPPAGLRVAPGPGGPDIDIGGGAEIADVGGNGRTAGRGDAACGAGASRLAASRRPLIAHPSRRVARLAGRSSEARVWRRRLGCELLPGGAAWPSASPAGPASPT